MSETNNSQVEATEVQSVASSVIEEKCLKDQTNKKSEGKPKGGDKGGKKKQSGKNADENEADGEFKLKTAKVKNIIFSK